MKLCDPSLTSAIPEHFRDEQLITNHNHTTTVLRPFFQDHPGEENFWTLWCKGRLTEADTPTIRLGTTPSGLTSAHLHLLPIFFTGRMPFLPPNQQCQSSSQLNKTNGCSSSGGIARGGDGGGRGDGRRGGGGRGGDVGHGSCGHGAGGSGVIMM